MPRPSSFYRDDRDDQSPNSWHVRQLDAWNILLHPQHHNILTLQILRRCLLSDSQKIGHIFLDLGPTTVAVIAHQRTAGLVPGALDHLAAAVTTEMHSHQLANSD